MRIAKLVCVAAGLSLLGACAPERLSAVDEQDVSCLLAELSAFSAVRKADPEGRSQVTQALTLSVLYRVGRLQGRHGDKDWPKVIDRLDPSVMKVRVYDKVQSCSQTEAFRTLMTSPELKAALKRLADREPVAP